MARWMLVRHGETEWNVEHRIQGHSDAPPPLTSVGIEQAQRLASRLTGTPLAAAYSSDLGRASKTAGILVTGHGIDVHELFDLRERNYGQWEGKTQAQWQAADPEGFAFWKRTPEEYVPPGGESLDQVMVRCSRVAARIKQEHPGDDDLLVVGHGAALLVLTVHLLGMPLTFRNNLDLSNASLSIIDVGADRTVIRLWNDVSHWSDKLH